MDLGGFQKHGEGLEWENLAFEIPGKECIDDKPWEELEIVLRYL